VVFEHAAIALVAVHRGKQPLQADPSVPQRGLDPHKDLLVLSPDGQLRLFVGCGLTLRVSLPPLLPSAYEPPSGTAPRSAGEPLFFLCFQDFFNSTLVLSDC